MGKQNPALVLSALCILAFGVAAADSETAQTAEAQTQKAVLVTGASTGIGRKITEVLAAKGYFVYAGARKDKDLAELNEIDNVQSVRLDVTHQDEIDAAVKLVREAGRGLHGIVNNAGVAVIEPLIEVDEEQMDFQFDVNVYGPYRVTKAFAPLLIESKGRMTTIGSISGILSGRFAGPYSMSKHAVEAYTDSLAGELAPFDVHVSVIEPGNYQSEIGKNVLRRMEERGFSPEGSLYEEELEQLMDWADRIEKDKDPQEVADAAVHALFAEKPLRRYMVVPNERQANITIRKALQEALQLNQWQAYSYSRDELVAMLEEELAKLEK
jgi:NAD(P)-dependent dehydrogenase (short-subunit alcohol dehydrogenase family)